MVEIGTCGSVSSPHQGRSLGARGETASDETTDSRVTAPVSHDGGGGHAPSAEDRGFPATQWTILRSLREATLDTRADTLNRLMAMYWKPVYCFVRRKGNDDETSKDLVQAFFAECIDRQTFSKADASRGRFRTFLLACLGRFLQNAHRAGQAKKRCPTGGIVNLDDVIRNDSVVFEPRDEETPEEIFHRAWIHDLLHRVLAALNRECTATGKERHFEIFRLRIVEPILQGAPTPPMCDLARRLGMSEKAACNCLLTARRAYQRLLRDEIRQYAFSEEDVANEVQDLFRFLGAVR